MPFVEAGFTTLKLSLIGGAVRLYSRPCNSGLPSRVTQREGQLCRRSCTALKSSTLPPGASSSAPPAASEASAATRPDVRSFPHSNTLQHIPLRDVSPAPGLAEQPKYYSLPLPVSPLQRPQPCRRWDRRVQHRLPPPHERCCFATATLRGT